MKTLLTITLFALFVGNTHTNDNVRQNVTINHAFTVGGTVIDQSGQALPGVSVKVKGGQKGTATDKNGKFEIEAPDSKAVLVFSYIGFKTKEVSINSKKVLSVTLQKILNITPQADEENRNEVVVIGYAPMRKRALTGSVAVIGNNYRRAPYHNTEDYSSINENIFHSAINNPLSTFSVDVDAASYSNLRRFINQGQLPPKDAVRIEEMINYFDYNYPEPKGSDPVSITTEITEAPWNTEHRLVHIGLQGKTIATENLPPSNLVFLIDVSGSMRGWNRLPLVKKAFIMLVDQLRPQDRVAIVTYAGNAGLVLKSTAGSEKRKIKAAIEGLGAGGSTAGAEGIITAYKIAVENYMQKGNNRVILATDGDFNVGVSSDGELQRLIEEKRKSGVFLSVLGFGMGNYKDNKLELLADKGNGNYAYIDNFSEAKKVFVNEFGGTLFTIAKDVKLQIEFNPKYVKEYRLIGYENRLLNDEDFTDDKKDAGEMGAGHTVTALYEIIPTGTGSNNAIPLKYQKKVPRLQANSNEVLTVKLRYKQPDGNKSKEISKVLLDYHIKLAKSSEDIRFAAAVAEFGLLLRDSKFKGNASYEQLIQLAQNSRGEDKEGYRAEFISIIKTAKLLPLNKELSKRREKVEVPMRYK